MKKLIAVLMSLMLLCSMVLPALAETAVKDETVYIIADSEGTARKIIVSDWISNPEGKTELKDLSRLTNIENVKDDQEFNGDVWYADGQDIYYQGESEEPLPVNMKITYKLDGQKIDPDEIAGKEGHVSIRFDYTVAKKATVTVNDQQKKSICLLR